MLIIFAVLFVRSRVKQIGDFLWLSDLNLQYKWASMTKHEAEGNRTLAIHPKVSAALFIRAEFWDREIINKKMYIHMTSFQGMRQREDNYAAQLRVHGSNLVNQSLQSNTRKIAEGRDTSPLTGI